MKYRALCLGICLLVGLILSGCVPSSITLPTIEAPIPTINISIPTLNPPSIGITLVPGAETPASSGSTSVPGNATPVPAIPTGTTLGSAAQLIFFVVLALLGVIAVIVMFVWFLRRKPDE